MHLWLWLETTAGKSASQKVSPFTFTPAPAALSFTLNIVTTGTLYMVFSEVVNVVQRR